MIDYGYTVDEFDVPEEFTNVPDHKLPFEVVEEHKRKTHNMTCDPNRKWRYHYVDGVFAAGTHYILKSNDKDEFNVEEVGSLGFLYAHGDTRTYKRLRANIQQGKPLVMLHNSGGVVTAFSWLQRVMAFCRPPPETSQIRGPLKFLIANLSKANWIDDFGVPEVIMMKGLAERAPALFRKTVVSVDILTQSEEEVLEVITGCFANPGGVPELGLGNAEVNVVFNAWMLHLTLCENAKAFQTKASIAQAIMWFLALSTTAASITVSSMGSGLIAAVGGIPAELIEPSQDFINYAVIILPIFTALFTTIASKMNWRDKWSVCYMCATQLAAEIYKYRMVTLEYDMSKPPPAPAPGEEPTPPLSAKEKARKARGIFVERVQAMYGACLTELSQGAALHRTRALVTPEVRHTERSARENRPTLAQWWKIKLHMEHHFYRAAWALPKGISFLNWISGLRPYLQQRTMREELRSVIEGLVASGKVKLVGKPLTDKQSRLVRETLARTLGIEKDRFDTVKDELRQLQRLIVQTLFQEKCDAEAAEEEARHAGEQLLDDAMDTVAGIGGRIASAAQVAPKPAGDVDEPPESELIAMQQLLMELQGLGPVKPQPGKKKAAAKMKEVEDDYLAGPLGVESYVVFRVRPIMEMLEKRSQKLGTRLMYCQVTEFIIQSTGAILAVAGLTEWVALTVAIASVIVGLVEYTQLRNQVVSVNLALRDLQNLMVWWDSLSLVRRRTPAVKTQVVDMTEHSVMSVVDAHTTAASNTQTSVEKNLASDAAEDDAEE